MFRHLSRRCLALVTSFLTFRSTVAIGLGSPLDYAPYTRLECPHETIVRTFTAQTQTLHPLEEDYVTERLQTVIPQAWTDWMGDGSGIGYNISQFEENLPKIGISISGGGERAAQYGAGALSGLDARNESAVRAGTGGLLQVSSYLAGLSGMRR